VNWGQDQASALLLEIMPLDSSSSEVHSRCSFRESEFFWYHEPSLVVWWSQPILSQNAFSQFFLLCFVLSLWQIPERNNFKGGKIYFGSWFHSMVSWPPCSPLLWTCTEAVHHGREGTMKGVLGRSAYLIATEKQTERGPEQGIASRTCSSDLLPLTRPHYWTFPSRPSNDIRLWVHQ
jgi:hypothetical protein